MIFSLTSPPEYAIVPLNPAFHGGMKGEVAEKNNFKIVTGDSACHSGDCGNKCAGTSAAGKAF